MSYIEYSLYDLEYSEEEIKQNVEKAIGLGINCLSVPYAWTKLCKTLIGNNQVILSNAIDYPLGILDTKTRNLAITNAIDNGAQKIEIVIQNNYLNNKKYDKIKADIKTNNEICQQRNVQLEYFLEYRIFTHQSLIKACNILLENQINNVYVSTGYIVDSLEDNLTASILLEQKTKINTTFTSGLWNNKQIETLKQKSIKRIRSKTIHGISLCKEL